ncbi:hypothetical protein Bpfe_020484 [Biomphalaria pfeifferi]|uniref:Uncharacterized protein n=1 Tax=Biomphalaria pfeifferi TaxID=112525 RepID=A0AAD8F499_BIOPF|nr:hypothetical protein Bpfe_020484 [Biomphalaria pfeifferi]
MATPWAYNYLTGRPSRSLETGCRTNCPDEYYRDSHYLYTRQNASVSDNGHEEVEATITTLSHEWPC